jgi:hypothetical protein
MTSSSSSAGPTTSRGRSLRREAWAHGVTKRRLITFDEPGDAPPPPPPPAAALEPRRRGRGRRRAALVGLLLLSAGLVAGGATLGWFLRGWVPGGGVGVTTVVVKRPVEIQAATGGHGTLPNVLGLEEGEARQAYADAGVDASAIATRSVPYVGQKGAVVEQRPQAASKIDTLKGRPTLLVAAPAAMPDLVGVDADDARRRLSAIGVGATTVVRYDASVDPGAVVRTRPTVGSPATARATLVVSEAPSSVDLAGLSPRSGSCRTGDADMVGATVAGAVLCDVAGDPVRTQYAINTKVTAFEAKPGLADGAPSGARVRVRIREDGRVAGTFTLGDRPRAVTVALRGGRVLTIEVERSDHGTDNATVVLQDARITGARSGIDALDAGSGP